MLTAALVILYFRQTTILDAQHELRMQELDRDLRMRHTETLRKRIELWHGNPAKETKPDPEPLDRTDLNLPMVDATRFRSAPTGSITAEQEDELFFVVPWRLHRDRYLDDLLENHAPALREVANEINALQEKLESYRGQFADDFEAGIVETREEYRVEPTDRLAEWVFNLLVRYERGMLDDFSDVRDRANMLMDGGRTSVRPDDSGIWLYTKGDQHDFAVYEAMWMSDDRDEVHEARSKVEEDLRESVDRVLDRVGDRYPYDTVVDAAEVLEDGEVAVNRLEQLLVEYHGRPMYPGDCQYLKENRIQHSS